MCNQLKNLRNWFFKDTLHSILIIFAFLIFISFFSIDMKDWRPAFYYPEVEYQLLENEVQMLTPDFNTVYHYKITSYDDETKNIKFKLYYKNLGDEPYLSVTIKNFGTENQELEYSRNSSSALTHTLRTLIFILITLIIHFFVYVAFLYLLYLVCCFIYWEFNKIKFHLHKKYEQKLNKAIEEMLTKSNLKNEEDKYEDSKSEEDEVKEDEKIEET